MDDKLGAVGENDVVDFPSPILITGDHIGITNARGNHFYHRVFHKFLAPLGAHSATEGLSLLNGILWCQYFSQQRMRHIVASPALSHHEQVELGQAIGCNKIPARIINAPLQVALKE